MGEFLTFSKLNFLSVKTQLLKPQKTCSVPTLLGHNFLKTVKKCSF